MDLPITPTLSLAADELGWRFSRSSGPGGQHVNRVETRVELIWSVAASRSLTPAQRDRLLERLTPRLLDGVLTITASERRSQQRNRDTARRRLAEIVAEALAPPPAARRATRPTRGSARRRLDAKARRSAVKQTRGRPAHDEN